MSARKHFQPGERIRLEITDAERELLLNNVFRLEDDNLLAEVVRDTPANQAVLLSLDELEHLAEDLAGASRHAEDPNLRAEADRLYDKVDGLIDYFCD